MQKNVDLYRSKLKTIVKDGAGGFGFKEMASKTGNWLKEKGKAALKKIMAPKVVSVYNSGKDKNNPVFNSSTGEGRNTNPGLSSSDQKITDESNSYANQVRDNNRNRADNGSAPVQGVPNKAPSFTEPKPDKIENKPQEVYQPPTPKASSGLTIQISPGTIAARHNNPGNLVYAGQIGATRGEQREDGTSWAKFKSPEDGYEALKNQVQLDQSRGQTIAEFVSKYAPPGENDTEKYIQDLTSKVNANRNTPLSDINASIIAKWLALFESSTTIS